MAEVTDEPGVEEGYQIEYELLARMLNILHYLVEHHVRPKITNIQRGSVGDAYHILPDKPLGKTQTRRFLHK